MQFTPDPLFNLISLWEESDRVTGPVVAWVLPVTRAVTGRDIRDGAPRLRNRSALPLQWWHRSRASQLAGRPSAITAEHVEIALRVSEQGGALSTVARACGTPLTTIKRWVQQAKEGTGSELYADFWAAIQEGRHKAEIRALKIITGSEDPRDAQWWLTHNPTTRDTWSDAAAERRTERKTVATVLEAVAAAGLPPELERTLLLQMQARGLGAAPQEGDG